MSSLKLKTHKMLWGKSGNRCAFPNCKNELVMNAIETDDLTIIGEEAHIVAKSIDGPRGNSNLNIEQRDLYSNLILLCSIHHKTVDDSPEVYTVEKLQHFKNEHEEWVKKNLHIDNELQRIDLIYSDYIDK